MKVTFSKKQNNVVKEVIRLLRQIEWNESAKILYNEWRNRNPKTVTHAVNMYEALGGENFTTKKVAAFGLDDLIKEEMPVVYDPYEGRSKNDD